MHPIATNTPASSQVVDGDGVFPNLKGHHIFKKVVGTCDSIWKTTVATLDLSRFIMHILKNSYAGRCNLLVGECEL